MGRRNVLNGGQGSIWDEKCCMALAVFYEIELCGRHQAA